MTTKGHIPAAVGSTGEGFAEPVVSLRLLDDGVVHRPLRQVTARHVLQAKPWRTARVTRGQTHYPGYFWSATTGAHVMYESRLELARLLLADFDSDVVGIAAQPFRIQTRIKDRVRRHVPDFLLVHSDDSVWVVNVKPACKLTDPAVAKVLDWPGRLLQAHGWGYEIWSGEDSVYLANVRFLAGYRRPGLVPVDLLEAVLAAVGPGACYATVLDRLEPAHPGAHVKTAVLRLLWQQRLVTDLSQRLDAHSRLAVAS
jgi:hypothetical protein